MTMTAMTMTITTKPKKKFTYWPAVAAPFHPIHVFVALDAEIDRLTHSRRTWQMFKIYKQPKT